MIWHTCFAYSMRGKTHAHRNYVDDVPDEVKRRRLTELIQTFRDSTGQCYDSQVGTILLVLVEGPNKRAPETELIGKSDRGHRVSFLNLPLPDRAGGINDKRNPVVVGFCGSPHYKVDKSITFGRGACYNQVSSDYSHADEEPAIAWTSQS